MLRAKFGHQFGDESAGLLRVEVTNLLRHIYESGYNLFMALLLSLLKGASSPTNLYWKLLTASVSHKLARLLLHILGGAGGLIDSPALIRSLPIAHFLHRPVAVLHCLIEGLLPEVD